MRVVEPFIFQLIKVDRIVLQCDGTEVDDEEYFRSLPVNTVFTALQPGETWQPDASSAVQAVVRALQHRRESLMRSQLLHHVQELLSLEETSPCARSFLLEVSERADSNSEAENREDDVTWFEGVDKRFKCKDDVMRDSARRRVRSYLNAARDYVKAHARDDRAVAQLMTSLLDSYKNKLSENDFYSVYFSRCQGRDVKRRVTSTDDGSNMSFCDERGWFSCEGSFSERECSHKHLINPFASRNARIVFSTWNLDHRIEKSRVVLPAMWAAISQLGDVSGRLNEEYFYGLLFTRANLRLVHVVCHDKKEHSGAICDRNKFYTKRKK